MGLHPGVGGLHRGRGGLPIGWVGTGKVGSMYLILGLVVLLECFLVTTHNEVVARLCFHRHLCFCSWGGVCMVGGACMAGDHAWQGGMCGGGEHVW